MFTSGASVLVDMMRVQTCAACVCSFATDDAIQQYVACWTPVGGASTCQDAGRSTSATFSDAVAGLAHGSGLFATVTCTTTAGASNSDQSSVLYLDFVPPTVIDLRLTGDG